MSVVGELDGAADGAPDPFGRDVARSATGLLARLNVEGSETDEGPVTIGAADVHVARRLATLGGCDDEAVLAAVALTVRATRLGSVCLDLGTLTSLAEDGVDWPTREQWPERLLASGLVRDALADGRGTPLVLADDRLYLDRYWRQEGFLVDDVRQRLATAPEPPDGLGAALETYFPAEDAEDDLADQRAAARAACEGWLTVVTGGPGTGKTTTIARLLGVLLQGDPTLRIALAAPTGRAAARMGEAIADATARPDFPPEHRSRIAGLQARTLHRLLGWLPGRRSFRHDATNKLPYDVVVVDESSMVSLTLMSQLLAAVRPQARIVLVGDADQLASVDAGAVLGDLVQGLETIGSPQVRRLERSRRFGARIKELAEAIRDGDGDAAVAALTRSHGPDAPDQSDRLDPSDGEGHVTLIGPDAVDDIVTTHAIALRDAATGEEPARALALLDRHRLLCAHREGPYGAAYWNRRVERALAEREHRPGGLGPWYAGRPVLVTANDYGLALYNGDVGVVVPVEGGGAGWPSQLAAWIASGTGSAREHAVARLSEVQSAHAMTVHRSQGSQVEEVTVLLPDGDSALLTRELFYTAVTRAERLVRVVGDEAAVRAAVGRRALRASGLAQRLAELTG